MKPLLIITILVGLLTSVYSEDYYATLSVDLKLQKAAKTKRSYEPDNSYTFRYSNSHALYNFQQICEYLKIDIKKDHNFGKLNKSTDSLNSGRSYFLVSALIKKGWKLVGVSSKPFYKDQDGFTRPARDVYHFTMPKKK